MSSKGKKIFLALTVIVPFLIYSIVYYRPIIRNAPFKAKEFVSLEYQWGNGKNLINSYNSTNGNLQYLNRNDSLVKVNFKLSERDIFYLDSIAHVQGFWNLPDIVANNAADTTQLNLLRYRIKFTYQKKSKEVLYFPSFAGNEKMKSAASVTQNKIERLLIDKENSLSK